MSLHVLYVLDKSQEPPDAFFIKNLKKINNNTASVNIYKTEKQTNTQSAFSTIFLEKEQNTWKIVDLIFVNSEESASIDNYGSNWMGEIVSLNIGQDN